MEISLPEFVSLGDSAIIVQWENTISRHVNFRVNALANALRHKPFAGLTEVVPAYSSLTICFDIVTVRTCLSKTETIQDFIKRQIVELMQNLHVGTTEKKQLVEIPVCYQTNLPNDLPAMSKFSGLAPNEIITRHTLPGYYVYMQGFLPGFAYMGEVDESIAFARKDKPVKVIAGAVGIAGRQTGIYPVDTPGGWQIIGYTPLKMFDAGAPSPSLLHAGDTVKFRAISVEEYQVLKHQKPV